MAVTVSWQSWVDAVALGVQRTPDEILLRAAQILSTSRLVLTAGNGGSHSLASHAAQALMKPGYAHGGGVAAVCLSDGVPTLTAHANDGGWPTALSRVAQPLIESHREAPESVSLLLFSSSGNSENIIRLATASLAYRCPIIAFTGFTGGSVRSLATLSVHVDSHDYEVVEPVHDALLHRVQYHLRELRHHGA